jgi:ADP-ribose pyrophosphatase YjhB (NUDIX family)
VQRYQQIGFCPRCGSRYRDGAWIESDIAFHCDSCEFMFYQNSVPSVSMLVPSARSQAEVLFVVRATEPDSGKLALPGGFLRYAEPPAAGAVREALEETTLQVAVDRLLTVYLVDYRYQGAQVSVLELAYLAKSIDVDVRGIHTAESSSLVFRPIAEILARPEQVAFPEQIQSLKIFQSHLSV